MVIKVFMVIHCVFFLNNHSIGVKRVNSKRAKIIKLEVILLASINVSIKHREVNSHNLFIKVSNLIYNMVITLSEDFI